VTTAFLLFFGRGDTSDVEQYPCTPGADFDPVPFPDNPAFAFGPDEFSLGDKTLDVDIHDAMVTGRLVLQSTLRALLILRASRVPMTFQR